MRVVVEESVPNAGANGGQRVPESWLVAGGGLNHQPFGYEYVVKYMAEKAHTELSDHRNTLRNAGESEFVSECERV